MSQHRSLCNLRSACIRALLPSVLKEAEPSKHAFTALVDTCTRRRERRRDCAQCWRGPRRRETAAAWVAGGGAVVSTCMLSTSSRRGVGVGARVLIRQARRLERRRGRGRGQWMADKMVRWMVRH